MNNDRRHPRHVRDSSYNRDRDGGRPQSGRGDGGYTSRGSRQWEGPAWQQPQARERNEPGMSWKRMDLHLHTPASSDYRDPGITYLDILKKAEEKRLDMIAFADHNTVAGYGAMHREIDILAELEKRNRLTDDERATLAEYRRLLGKIVVLPAFEFTATFGFHILGIFPENTSIRKLEYLLLDLNVPEEKMLAGAPDAGSTSDVLRAYAAITAAGGMAIAAHANSSNGVAMQGFPFGGQTKIAYTQDPNLVALEVTDMEASGRRTTASFFNGSKTEYPRRMHLLQGSDAHSLETEQMDSANKRLGVGARITEFYAKDASWAALKEIFSGDDFTRIRPARGVSAWEDIEKARAEGPTLTTAFHERASTKTSRTRPVLHDIVAFANTEGGCIYIGASHEPRLPIHGVEQPEEAMSMLRSDIQRSIEPPVEIEYDVKESGGRAVIVATVPAGEDTPYMYTPTGQIYIRQGGESVLATRQEIVDLVRRSAALEEMEAGADVRPTEGVAPAPRERRPSTSTLSQVSPAVPVPSSPQVETPRYERASDQPQREQDQQRQGWGQRQGSAPSPAQAAAQAQPPQEPVHRAPAFPNLPPEKIKGKVQPMAPRTGAGQADTARLSPAEVESEPTEAAGAGKSEQITSPLRAEQAERATGERSADTVRLSMNAVEEEPSPEQAAEQEAQPVEAPAKRPSRRSRKTKEEPVAEAPAPEEPVMEATVSAQHMSREEIVAEEKPKRSRKGRSKKELEKLEVEAPAASAAATEPGIEAVIEETQEEAQALAEEKPPAPKSRSRRRKKDEEQAAPVEVAEARAKAPVEPAQAEQPAAAEKKPRRSRKKAAEPEPETPAQPAPPPPGTDLPDPPTMGVEIVDTGVRDGVMYHTVRNLRDHTTVHNVTRRSARRLWHYAILQHEHGLPEISEVLWHPDLPIGLWRRDQRAGAERYDLVLRTPEDRLCVYYGVTEDGLEGPWQEVVAQAEQANYYGPDPAE